MTAKHALALLAATLTATFAASTAQADYKKCHIRSDGAKVCDYYTRVSKPRKARIDVGSRKAEEFGTGSSDWWIAMDREGRGGFGRR